MKPQNPIYNVLVIDDDEFLLEAIKKKLDQSGYRAIISNNVHDAIFKMGLKKPDLILIDIIMPDMNGLELMSIFRANYSDSKIPVILMSCLTKKEVLDMGYSIGETQYLVKPFNIDRLPVILEQSR